MAPTGLSRTAAVVAIMATCWTMPVVTTPAAASSGAVPPVVMRTASGLADVPDGGVSRLAGFDRRSTAIQVAFRAFPAGANEVFIAREDRYSDAIAGGVLTGGPTLLVPGGTTLPVEVADAIGRLHPTRVTALGGEASVTEAMLLAAAGGRLTSRLAGTTRRGTAAAIAMRQFPAGATEVFVAQEDSVLDALAAGSLTTGPILLVPSVGPPPVEAVAVIDAERPERVIALGGESAVSGPMLAALARGRFTDRIAGADAATTSVLISQRQFPLGTHEAFLARVDQPVDAIAAGSLATGPVLFVSSCGSPPPSVLAEITRLGASRVTALGGEASICSQALFGAMGARRVEDGAILMMTPDVAAPGNPGWVWFPDGTKQAIDPVCRARLERRGVPQAQVTVAELPQWPDGARRDCNSIYGKRVDWCPQGAPGDAAIPPSTCSSADYVAVWLSAAGGGSVRLGEYSIDVPPSLLSRDCYASVMIVDRDARLADFDIGCPWRGSVTITAPRLLPDGTEGDLIVPHMTGGGVVEERGTPTADGRVSAQVTSLSPVSPSVQSKLNLIPEAFQCMENVRNTLSFAQQLLLGNSLDSYSALKCIEAWTLRTSGEQAAAQIGGYDTVTDVDGQVGPSDAARHCAWSAAITLAMGEKLAEATTSAHELTSSGLPRLMDLRNNNAGRYVGRTAGSLAAAVSQCIGRAKGERGGEILWVVLRTGGNLDLETSVTYKERQTPPSTGGSPPPVTTTPQPPVTVPGPGPGAQVVISRGASVNRPECYSASCAWINYSATGFDAGAILTITCSGDGAPSYYRFTTTANGSGAKSGGPCFWGFSGTNVWMEVNGVRSNTIRW